MLNSTPRSASDARPEIADLFQRLSDDGRQWAKAEVDLAKIELGELKSQVIKGVIFAVIGFAAAFCTLVVLSQAGIAFLTPYVDSVGLAALVVGGILLLLVVISLLVVRSSFSWKPESIILRWFGGASKDEDHAR